MAPRRASRQRARPLEGERAAVERLTVVPRSVSPVADEIRGRCGDTEKMDAGTPPPSRAPLFLFPRFSRVRVRVRVRISGLWSFPDLISLLPLKHALVSSDTNVKFFLCLSTHLK